MDNNEFYNLVNKLRNENLDKYESDSQRENRKYDYLAPIGDGEYSKYIAEKLDKNISYSMKIPTKRHTSKLVERNYKTTKVETIDRTKIKSIKRNNYKKQDKIGLTEIIIAIGVTVTLSLLIIKLIF